MLNLVTVRIQLLCKILKNDFKLFSDFPRRTKNPLKMQLAYILMAKGTDNK